VLDGISATSRHSPVAWLGGEALAALLVPLCAAQEVLARLDAGAAAALAAVREGLCARLAFAEAAGWLAHAHAWVHPPDLALRELGLTGSYGIATYVGRPMREMPNTYVRRGTRAWEEQGTAAMMAATSGSRPRSRWHGSLPVWPARARTRSPAWRARRPRCTGSDPRFWTAPGLHSGGWSLPEVPGRSVTTGQGGARRG
jgi:hypothetical protein